MALSVHNVKQDLYRKLASQIVSVIWRIAKNVILLTLVNVRLAKMVIFYPLLKLNVIVVCRIAVNAILIMDLYVIAAMITLWLIVLKPLAIIAKLVIVINVMMEIQWNVRFVK